MRTSFLITIIALLVGQFTSVSDTRVGWKSQVRVHSPLCDGTNAWPCAETPESFEENIDDTSPESPDDVFLASSSGPLQSPLAHVLLSFANDPKPNGYHPAPDPRPPRS